MMKILVSIFSLFILAGCQSNDVFTEDREISSIEVQDYDTEESVMTITDSSIIDPLVEELETASTSSTDNMDLMNADYSLLFLDNDQQLVHTFGYYVEEQNLGVIGRYHSRELGEHFAVTTELPIEEMD